MTGDSIRAMIRQLRNSKREWRWLVSSRSVIRRQTPGRMERSRRIYCVEDLESAARQSLQMPPTSVRDTVTLMSQSREI
jgi:hypothetical protein